MLAEPNRKERAAALARETKARRTGRWGEWKHFTFPKGTVPAYSGGDPDHSGWSAQVDEAWSNDLYAVMKRDAPAGVTHLAIRTVSHLEPPWRDLQRIKNELFGPERFAVQVCPPVSRLVDEANMYHLWVMPEGHVSPFGLHYEEEREP